MRLRSGLVLVCALGAFACSDNPTELTSNNTTTSNNSTSNNTTTSNNSTSNNTTTSNGSTGNSNPEAVDRLAQQHIVACGLAFDCETAAVQLLTTYGRFESLEDCLASPPIPDPFISKNVIPSEQDGLSKGRIKLNPGYDFAECTAEQQAHICTGAAYSPECTPYVPQLAEGELCNWGECVDGLFCDKSGPSMDASCAGVCSKPLCDGAECAADEYCDIESCVPKGAEGDQCEISIASFAYNVCNDGLECQRVGSDYKCLKGGVVQDGGACLVTFQCVSGAECAGDNTCVTRSRLAIGEVCDFGSTTAFCAAGTVCADTVDGVGVCATPKARDQDCTDSRECVYGLACRDGICGEPALDGDACNIHADCLPSGCIRNVCEPFSSAYDVACIIP